MPSMRDALACLDIRGVRFAHLLNANLVDDSGSFVPTDRGCAFFDLVNTGARTFTGHEDATGGGTQPNGC